MTIRADQCEIQYEPILTDWIEGHRGYRRYVAIAGRSMNTTASERPALFYACREILRAGGHSNHLIRHSMHSREEFFTRGESLSLCRRYMQVLT